MSLSGRASPLAHGAESWLNGGRMRAVLIASLAAPLLLAGGCGSISSHWNGRHGPYVGVKFDAEQVRRYTDEQDVHESEVIAALDIPLSAIVDTILLPYDLSVQKREASEQEASTRAAARQELPKAESPESIPAATSQTNRVSYPIK
jgi:uncharacterized protein YceK